jgi:hypothetical protein
MFRFLVRRPIAAPWDAKEQRVGDLMERLLPVASALGLFAEEFDVRSTPRNLPQAFSHLALIEAAAGIRESPTAGDALLLWARHDRTVGRQLFGIKAEGQSLETVIKLLTAVSTETVEYGASNG